MQHLEGSGMPVLYIGRTVLKGLNKTIVLVHLFSLMLISSGAC